ncbi:MAG: hypothetical protein ABIN94_03875 [Ferruginibacter sp.]
MPTKIVSEKSNPKDGIINKQDLNRIIQDFENFVEIKSTIARNFQKVDLISIPVPILEHLLSILDPAEKPGARVNIKMGICLPDQKDCTDGKTDISNYLTAVVFLSKNGNTLLDQVEDFIITPGFKEFGGAAVGACCPLIHPD